MSFLIRLSNLGASISTMIAMWMLAIMTILIFLLVVTRYFFSYSFPWTEELTRYLMVWMAFLSASALIQRDSHLSIDFISSKLSSRSQDIFFIMFRLLEMAFLLLLIHKGWAYAQSVQDITSPAIGISMIWPSLAIPTTAVLMFFFSMIRVIQKIVDMFGRRVT